MPLGIQLDFFLTKSKLPQLQQYSLDFIVNAFSVINENLLVKIGFNFSCLPA